MRLFLVFSLYFLPALVLGQQCSAGATVGPCNRDQSCNAPQTLCIANQCCPFASVITAAPSMPTAAPCVDKLNPNTGVSDCPNVAYLCNDLLYKDVMKDQCPKTCNLCGSSSAPAGAATTPSSCRDKLNPQTGVSDCPNAKHLCQDLTWHDVMKDQCPKTCGYCS